MDEPAEAKRQAPIDPRLLEILVCPLTKGPLEYDREASELISRKAGLAYPVRDGIPIMLPEEARKLEELMAVATEIRLNKAERVLHVAFDDGSRFALPAEYLRVESPSAEVQGHGPDQKRIVPGKRAGRASSAIEPVGNYAVRLIFDDLHDTGIYLLGLSARAGPRTGPALAGVSGGAGGARDEPRRYQPAPAARHAGRQHPPQVAQRQRDAAFGRRIVRPRDVQEDRRPAPALHRRVVPAQHADQVVRPSWRHSSS